MGKAALADLKITHEVVGVPARVEVQDLDNPQSIKRFDLETGGSKVVSVTGIKCRVRVYQKGNGAQMSVGDFPSNQTISVQSSGTKWVLKRVSR